MTDEMRGRGERGNADGAGETSAPEETHRRRHRGHGHSHTHSERTFQATDRAEAYAALKGEDGREADIAPELLDRDGLKILNCLHRRGFEAYFVGGCVRDLILGETPKDFDISTTARPEEIRALFGNSRLIGRRFRLVHVFFRDGKIIEVSTFRASPPHASSSPDETAELLEEDLLITRDNDFGTPEEDALRRDLTINGLFYDVRQGRVLDFSGQGISDLRDGLIRTIGDPFIRMREDPVRILRAVRFAARFGFAVEEKTASAMEAAVNELARCTAPRLLEETFKFFRAGVTSRAFPHLLGLGALDHLLRPVAEWLRQASAEARASYLALLSALDELAKAGNAPAHVPSPVPPDDAFFLGAAIAPLVWSEGAAEVSGAADAFLDDLCRASRLPHRMAETIRRAVWAESVMTGKIHRRRSLRSFRAHPDFDRGLKLLLLHAAFDRSLLPIFEAWARGDVPESIRAPKPAKAQGAAQPEGGASEAGSAKKRRRRGGRRRRGSGERPPSPEQAAQKEQHSEPSAHCEPPPSGERMKNSEGRQLSFGF